MPVLRFIGEIRDRFSVRAAMLFPNDPEAIERFIAVEQTKAVIAGEPDSNTRHIDIRTLRLILDSPSYPELKNQVTENSKKAFIAGDLLASLYVMDRFGIPRPSMNKAIFVVLEYAKKAEYGDGEPLPISEPTIRRYWNEFLPVAHFWAAFRLGRVYPYSSDPLSEDIEKFLMVAQGIFEFGKGFIPQGSKSQEPILDSEKCWALPEGIQAMHLNSQRKPEKLIKILKKYKAPKSTSGASSR